MVISEKTGYCALRYHQRTFDLAGIIPELDPSAEAQLIVLETQLGQKLPASLREWYSLKNGADLLIGGADHVQTIAELKLANLQQERNNWADTWLYMPDDMLLIIVENQGVCLWTVQLNGSDDPPVYTRINEPDGVWQRCANHFSDFIYHRVWDYANSPAIQHALLAVTTPLTIEQRLFLMDHYAMLPASLSRPDVTSYRFYNAIARLLIDVSADGQAEWYIFTESKLALQQFLHDLQALAGQLFKDVLRELWREYDRLAV